MNTFKLILAFYFLVLLPLKAQETMQFSLDEAKSFAMEHNKSLKNAKIDTEIAKKSVWEAISTGLPQVSASFDYTNFFNYEFDFSFGGGGMTPEQVTSFESQLTPGSEASAIWNTFLKPQYTAEPTPIVLKDQAGAKLQVSQLVFSGQFLIGVQSAKLAKELMAKSLSKTELDVTEMVTSAYYLTLVTQESLNILNENIANLDKMVQQTQNLVDAGMAEQIDADQLKITSVQLKNSQKSMERNLALNLNMLRFQLGLESGTNIQLTTSMSELVSKDAIVESTLSDFVLSNNIDYQLYEGQEDISEKMLKLEKSAYLPTVSAFYTYNAKFITTDFDMNAPHVIGFNVSLPLFTSWNRVAKVQRAKLELDKVRNTKSMLAEQLTLQSDQLKYNLKTAMENYTLQKENVELSQRVYSTYSRKYKEGIISSMDLTQANSANLEAQSNYIQSVMSLLQAKLALDKLNNSL